MRWSKLLQRIESLVVLAAAAVLFAGCVAFPAPGKVLVVPDLVGRVVRDGEPVAGLKVSYLRVLSGDDCAQSRDTAVTDATGQFRIPTRSAFQFWMVVPYDPSNRWGFCLYPEGRPVVGWVGRGIGFPPAQASFECDLASAADESGGGFGVCRRVGI